MELMLERAHTESAMTYSAIKRLLLITFHFPPDGEIGAVRPYEIARLLPEHGIEVWILTVNDSFAERLDPEHAPAGKLAERVIRTGVGPTRFDRFSKATASVRGLLRKFRRSRSDYQTEKDPLVLSVGEPRDSWRWTLLSWLIYPDFRAGWIRPATIAAERAVRDIGFDWILSTSPPRSAHLIAAQIARRHRIPWIMDLRDPWFGSWGEGSSIAGSLIRLYERAFLKCAHQAEWIVVNTERSAHALASQYPEIERKVVEIPNGYRVEGQQSVPDGEPAGFVIGYIGFMTGKRTAKVFFEGVRLFLDRYPERGRGLRIRFIGGGFETDDALYIRPLGLAEVVSLEPARGRSEIPRLMAQCYVLLLIANNQSLQVPGKLYEYFGAERRLLTITEADSATADALAGLSDSHVAVDADSVASALDDYWTQYSSSKSARVDRQEVLSEISYESRMAEFAEIMKKSTSPLKSN